jgi:large subunit ribosomal protein L7/L12
MASDSPTPPDRPSTSLRDAMAAAARRKAPRPRGVLLLWAVVGGAVLIVGISQMAGWTKSPVVERMLGDRREAARGTGAAPATAPAAARRTVVLVRAGDRVPEVIRAVREATGLGLADAKALVEAAPKAVATDVEPGEAERVRDLLETAGAVVEVR